MILAGRGFGKTRSGTEWVREQVKAGCGRIAILAETAADARDVIVEGQSGILAVCPKDERPLYEPSKRRLTFPNGAVATLYNGTEPDQLRGPEHDAALVDELAKYQYAQDTWDNLQFGLRLSENPRSMVTTTPRPIPIIRSIVQDSGTVITRGSTFDNSDNLPKRFIDVIRKRYEGTRIGRQELFAEILDDIPGALWTAAMIRQVKDHEDLVRVVVGVDPSGASGDPEKSNNAIGIVAVAKTVSGRFVVLEDATCSLGPTGWGRRVDETSSKYDADKVVAEGNFGGAMVESVLRTVNPSLPVKMVSASRGKVVRAEPIAALYEQGRVDHMPRLELLEDQMTHMTLDGYLGDGSPDRVDALVWALTELAFGPDHSVGLILSKRHRR
jgi:phage terminase large subunit-like protein